MGSLLPMYFQWECASAAISVQLKEVSEIRSVQLESFTVIVRDDLWHRRKLDSPIICSIRYRYRENNNNNNQDV